MRKYCIHFEPFLNSFKKKFIGIDLSFWSEYLAPEKIVEILDKVFDDMSLNSNSLEKNLCQEFGLKDVKLSTYKTSTKWFKDGDYHKYSRKKQKQLTKICPEDEVHLTVFNISGKPYLERSEELFDDILVVDYQSAEFNWNYEISAYFDSGQKEFYGEIVTTDSRKSEPIRSKYHNNLHGESPSTESSIAWTVPLLTEVTFYDFEAILKNIGKVETIDNLFRIAPHLSDF